MTGSVISNQLKTILQRNNPKCFDVGLVLVGQLDAGVHEEEEDLRQS